MRTSAWTNALTFSGFGTLQGGTAVDTFTLGGATTFNLKGGDGIFFFNDTATTEIYTLSLHDALPIFTGLGSATLTALGGTTGFNGTSANVSTGFSNITDLQGTGTFGRAHV